MARLFDRQRRAYGTAVRRGGHPPLGRLWRRGQLADGDLQFTWTAYTLNGSDLDVVRQRWGLFEEQIGTVDSDLIVATPARDRILAAEGEDQVFGGASGDQLDGQAGDDTLSGDGGDDFLFGGRGADLLFGGDGDDVLDGSGSSGDAIDDGPDELVGGDGSDTASYGRAVTGVSVDLGRLLQQQQRGGGDTYSGIENLTGSRYADAAAGR
jgi:hypothetical protein